MPDNAIYDDETEDFIFDDKYDFKTLKKKLITHFKDGGLYSNPVVAGVCGVSRGTIWHWRNRNSLYYRPEFDALVRIAQEEAILVTDKWHRESASGKRRHANSQTLNRRAERMLGLTETVKTVQEVTHKYESLEEYDAEIAKVKEEQENE